MPAPSRISKYVSILYRHNQQTMAKRLEPLGIGMGQYPYIISVCRQPGITQDGLSCDMLCNKSTVARAAAQLERNGFVRRETDPMDKRSYRLYPTPKALDALDVVMEKLGELNDQLTAGFTRGERALAESLLARMARNVAKGKEVAP